MQQFVDKLILNYKLYAVADLIVEYWKKEAKNYGKQNATVECVEDAIAIDSRSYNNI